MEGGEQKMKNIYIIFALLLIVIGGGAFFAGMKYQQSQVSARGQYGQLGSQRGQRQFTGRGNGIPVVGQIVNQDANSMTIKTQDGSSKIVLFSDNTTISKTDTASKSAIKTGDNIAVFGTSNSDGSVTAQNIQLNPMFRTGQNAQPNTPQ